MNLASASWRGRRVLVTGHTGFFGSWLCIFLEFLGADVHGYALGPPTEPSLYSAARAGEVLSSDTRADISDLETLRQTVNAIGPEVVIHLAAQPLVSEGYADPLGTWRTNVIGTANLLEAVRDCQDTRSVVVATTDKVYEVGESDRPFRETDRLGGRDPYSASKASAELVVDSFRQSFFDENDETAVRIATVRSGNSIGGGDWAENRLIPDCLRAFASDEPARIRFPNAIRPWQHVLEPLAGYLALADRLLSPNGDCFTGGWNFGPGFERDVSAAEVAELVAKTWGPDASVVGDPVATHMHETEVLRLDSTEASRRLGWFPRWTLTEAIDRTVVWHKAWLAGDEIRSLCSQQIRDYVDEG